MQRSCTMGKKDINRLKVVLVEQKHTARGVAEQVRRAPATVSKWCTNTLQPNFGRLRQMADRDRGVLYFSKEHDYTVKYWHIADDKTSSATHILMDYKSKVV